ncbi:hypothetical protein [Sphingomonas xinjiangensis]|uniref:Uncharacterized protein n=1 Tax=Sphingomonas xinjiangensis TaxID=643568 RepID=A0A840Y7Q6_9SPHN|nr:hypothetical protein [Sphingomonas xinjiangensis]MBB5709327.1 hypothetical protein [Sphingomonas xinjiangensis]
MRYAIAKGVNEMLTLLTIAGAIWALSSTILLLAGLLCVVSPAFRAHIMPVDSPAPREQHAGISLVVNNTSAKASARLKLVAA